MSNPGGGAASVTAEQTRAQTAEAALQAQLTAALNQLGLTPNPPAQFHRTNFACKASDATVDAANVRAVIVQADSATIHDGIPAGPFDGIGYVRALKAANPNIKAYAYIDTFRVRSTDPYGITTVPSIPTADILLDQVGAQFGGTAGKVADPASADMQARIIAHIGAMLAWGPFDGVFLDEISASISWFAGAGQTCPKYPTDASWQAAIIAMLNNVVPAIKAATPGTVVLGNVNVGSAGAAIWESLATPLDGAMIQGFADGGTGILNWTWQFAANLAQLVWCEANGKSAFPQMVNSTEVGGTYGLAAMLLASQGNESLDLNCTAALGGGNPGTAADRWWPEFATAQKLGAPLGPYSNNAGFYTRAFSNGSVSVNTTGATVAGVPAYSATIVTGPNVPWWSKLTTNAAVTPPRGTYLAKLVSGGSGGGNGGVPTSLTTTQVGGGGGAGGALAEVLIALDGATAVTPTIGAGGAAGSVGAATTLAVAGGATYSSSFPTGGVSGGANSAATVAGGSYGNAGNWSAANNQGPGGGGSATSTSGLRGNGGLGLAPGGGSGGANQLSQLVGGLGGNAGGPNAGGAAPAGTGSGSANGGAGADAAANTGAGGGGGGAAGQGGVAGAGGHGGSGFIILNRIGS